jgi:hypothetical protein
MPGITTLTAIGLQLLQAYMEIMRMSGRTPEEADAFYQSERAKFYGPNAPENLPKPPE